MFAPAITPSIEVTIGRETRLYHAFITTAPTTLDAPATVTLHNASLSDVSGMAADPIALNTTRANAPARLVLVDGTELAWQRARYREARHLFAPADPVLVGLNTLQHWLWSRIGSAAADLDRAACVRDEATGRRHAGSAMRSRPAVSTTRGAAPESLPAVPAASRMTSGARLSGTWSGREFRSAWP